MGAISSVGHDVVTACAAIRAGLASPSPLTHFPVLEEESQQSVPLMGHAVAGMTDGFSSVGRWLQMAPRAFDDLVRSGALPDRENTAFWQRTGVVFATPVLDDERFEHAVQCHPERIGHTFVEPMLLATHRPPAAANHWLVSEGHRGALCAIADAAARIHHTLERVVVIAVDSWLDAFSLSWLAERHRLKTDENPVGMMPGEAAVALLIEARGAAERRHAKVLASIVGLSLEQEEMDSGKAGPGDGAAQGRALAAAMESAKIQAPFEGDLVVDHNGESWRGHELAMLRTRGPRRLLGNCRVVAPALSTGDTGAASAALGIACGVRSLQRGYSAAEKVVVQSRSDWGGVGILILSS